MSEAEIRETIAKEILKWHTPNDNTTGCMYGECTHEEDASIAREAKAMYKYECPACGNVIITNVKDDLECPTCPTTLELLQ